MSFRSVRAGALVVLFCSIPALAQAETLREALTAAYQNNPQILSALLNVKATAENIVLAKTGQRPVIGAQGSLSDAYQFDGSLPNPTLSVGASYSQTLFDNHKTEADVEGARALTEASRYSLQNAEQNVLLSVVQAYWGVIENTQLVQLAQDNVKFFQAQVDSANDRLKIGEGTKIDVSQAQARLAQGSAAYESAVAALQTSQAQYEEFVGHKPSNLTSSYKLGSLMPKSLDSAIAEATSSHPAILAAKAGIRAAQANSDAANAAYGPTIAMVGAISSNLFGPTSAFGQPNDPTPTASLKFNLTIPIYEGGALGANIRKTNIGQIKSEVDALTTRDQVKAALISAWSTLQNATAQIQSANSAVSAGQLALEGTVQERDVGQATTLDVLNAQSELTSTKQALIQATASKAIASFAVVSATGHLTAADLGLPVVVQTGEDYIAKVEDVWAELRALD
jgi:outer membrane protein